MPLFQNLSHNIIQQEIGPRSTIFPGKDSASFSVDTRVLDESIVPLLRSAESNHLAVNLLLSPHYFPKWALEKWPSVANPTSGNFLSHIPDAPEAKEIVEAHILAVISKVRGLPALNSFCLANEPELIDTRRDPYSQSLWKNWLEKKHGSIEVLNRRYGTAYQNFTDVPMVDPGKPEETPAFYDHSVWNAERFSAWHLWMAEVVHRTAPEIPVHVKIMQNIFERHDRIGRGVNPEDFCLLSDINGCDAWVWPGEENWGRDQFAFYDLLRSIKKTPIFNSEDHYIRDRDKEYGPERATHVRSELFMGAFHGREASTAWVWDRTYDEKHDFEGSVLHRPDVVAEAGHISLEIQQQASLIAQFNDASAQVAILYSWPSLVYSGFYASSVKSVYDALRQNGQKIDFITERQLREGRAGNYRVIVLAESSHVSESVLPFLEKFVSGGGKIVSVGDRVISKDEWNQPLPDKRRQFILSGALSYSTLPNLNRLRKELFTYFEKMELSSLSLIDVASGNAVENVEYRSLSISGKQYLVALNYDSAAKKVKFVFKEKTLKVVSDLLSGKTLSLSEWNLEPLTPTLLEVR